jgi:hypothetical protein
MPAKVEWHENRLGFQLQTVRKWAPDIMMMMTKKDLR